MIITEDKYSAINAIRLVLLTSLDIEKAYDMIWCHQITDLLQKQKINCNILAHISNFQSNLRFSVKLDETYSSYRLLRNGILQGSSLSVKFFIIVINALPNIIPDLLNAIMFANCNNMYCKIKNINTSKALIEQAIEYVFE